MTDPDSKSMLIEEIIYDALGHLADWQKPIVKKSIGPQFPQLADEYCAEIQAIKETLREMLDPLPQEALTEGFQTKNYNGRRLLRDPNGTSFQIVNRIKSLESREPAWFISGWHVKAVELDAAHWRAFSSCTLTELTLLSVGLDPRYVNYHALFKRYGHLDPQDKMLGFIEDQFEAIANGLGIDPENEEVVVELSKFYAWTKKVIFKIDSKFRTLLREKFNNLSDETASPLPKPGSEELKPIHKSSYNLHARLLYAIAIEKYGMKGLSDIGRTAKKMQGDAELQGQTPALRPIRLLLKKGHELSSTDDAP